MSIIRSRQFPIHLLLSVVIDPDMTGLTTIHITRINRMQCHPATGILPAVPGPALLNPGVTTTAVNDNLRTEGCSVALASSYVNGPLRVVICNRDGSERQTLFENKEVSINLLADGFIFLNIGGDPKVGAMIVSEDVRRTLNIDERYDVATNGKWELTGEIPDRINFHNYVAPITEGYKPIVLDMSRPADRWTRENTMPTLEQRHALASRAELRRVPGTLGRQVNT